MTALFYDLIFILPVCVLAVTNAGTYIGITENMLIYYIASAVILACCFSLKHVHSRMRFILPGISLMFAVGMILVQDPSERDVFLRDNIWFLWMILVVVLSFMGGWLIAVNRKCRLAGAIVLFAALIYLMIRGILPDKLQAAASFLLLVFVLVDEIQRLWEKSGYTDRKGHIVSVAPFIILLGLIVFFIPAPDKPYDWNIAKQIIRRISDGIKYGNRLINSDKEEYAGAMGFKENGTYFGDLFVEDDELMEITTDRNTGRVIYLTGRILDDFNGREWSGLNNEQNMDQMLDSIQTFAAIQEYDKSYSFDYYKKVDISIKYDEFNTAYYFVPPKLIKLAPGKEKETAEFSAEEIKSAVHLGFSTHYDLSYFRLNSQNKGFKALMDNAEAVDREKWDHYCYANNYRNTEGFSYEDYLEYINRVYEYYLPETKISQKAEEYIAELSEGTEDKIEVLNRLDKVLSGFSYTLSPGELPEDVKTPADFVDHVLFETQEGYCTHYATAFVIIARSMGVPARFVQGFLVPLTGRQPYIVRSSMAHAWAEVYIDGLGWIQYEPTPGIDYDNSWSFMSRDIKPDTKESNMPAYGREEQEAELPIPEMAGAEDDEPVNWRVILVPAGLIMLFLLCFILTDRAIRRIKYKKMGMKERAVYDCRRCIRLLGVLGLKQMKGETLEEYHERSAEWLFDEEDEEEEARASCLDFLEAYEYILYAKNTGTENFTEGIDENMKEILLLIRERKGFLHAFFAGMNIN